MARGKPCVLRVPGVCNQDPETTVACHSNISMHGKAAARKSDDQYVVWGCSSCHSWLDFGKAGYWERAAAFMRALEAMKYEYRAIGLLDELSDPKDLQAAQWALQRLANESF